MLGDLTDRDRAILALEVAWPRHTGAKEEEIRARLGMSAARYYQLLWRLVETEQALEHDPLLVRRLRRIRDARTAQRTARMPGFVG
ncbi:DUF3263 domain-containing protein [Microbacterium sp. NPDC055903]